MLIGNYDCAMKYPVTRGKNIFTKTKKILFMHFRKGRKRLIRIN